jgi:hypothetical protein
MKRVAERPRIERREWRSDIAHCESAIEVGEGVRASSRASARTIPSLALAIALSSSAGKTRRDTVWRNAERGRYAGARRPAEALAEPRGAHFAPVPRPLPTPSASPQSAQPPLAAEAGVASSGACFRLGRFQPPGLRAQAGFFAPDVESELPPGSQTLGLSGMFRGHAAMEQAISEFAESWSSWGLEPAYILDLGDRLLFLGFFRGRGHERSTARAGIRAIAHAAGRARDARRRLVSVGGRATSRRARPGCRRSPQAR